MKSKTKPQSSLSVVSSLYLTQNSQCSVSSIIRAFILLLRNRSVTNILSVTIRACTYLKLAMLQIVSPWFVCLMFFP